MFTTKYLFREPIREPRRVGSGRLISRDSWDTGFRQQENGIASNYNFGKGGFRESSSHNSMLVIIIIVFSFSFYNILCYLF